MDMHSRKEYLKRLQQRYFQCQSKKEKTSILNEYCKNTRQNRKYVISRMNSSFSSRPKEKRKRKRIYDGYLKAALTKIWDIFDEPCGQRLAPLLKTEVDRLRQLEEIFICNEVAGKLKRISPRTIDRALRRQKEALHLNRKYRQKRNPLIYQKIPVKAGGWDRSVPGQLQVDLVEHCGQSASGLFGNTVSVAEVAFGWWEGEAVLGKGQEASFDALKRIRERSPFNWVHVHPDNDKSFINWHLFRYCKTERIEFSRSRPYQNNDNNFVEQKNSTHVRAVIGHLRYDTEKELEVINSLYRGELRLYKNFFQPVMKLKEKIRDKGKVHRKYDIPKTPYQRIMESEKIPEENKKELRELYQRLNPAELKRKIDEKIHLLFKTYEEKNRGRQALPSKKQTPRRVRFYMTQQQPIGLGR
ncbi:ISNCY family transposase ISKol11 [subsurface metagenome]